MAKTRAARRLSGSDFTAGGTKSINIELANGKQVQVSGYWPELDLVGQHSEMAQYVRCDRSPLKTAGQPLGRRTHGRAQVR